jgi:hypothetical protein
MKRSCLSIGQSMVACLAALVVLGWLAPAMGDVSVTLTFSPEEIAMAEIQGYQLPSLPECSWITEVGDPSLPVVLEQVLVGPAERVREVVVTHVEMEELPGEYLVYPSQEPTPIGDPPGWTEPNPEVYGSNDPYPGEVIRLTGQGNMTGYRMAALEVFPVQYVPSEERLMVCRSISFTVRTEPGATAPRLRRTPLGIRLAREGVESVVVNDEDVDRYAPPVEVLSANLDDGFEYLLVTTEEFAPEYERLIEWKNQRGVRAVIRTAEWIDDNYPTGIDRPERIRDYAKIAFQDSGLVFLLLGGDVGLLPHRSVFEDASATLIPCDMYFSDLDGTWDDDNDGVYGEVNDNLDLYPDIFVGRAPVETPGEIANFIDKMFTYEMPEVLDYQTSVLFLADSLDEVTDCADLKDDIEATCVPLEFPPVMKLYALYGNLNRGNAIAELNGGHALVNHNGHGNWNIMEVGHGTLSCGDFYVLENGPEFTMFYTLGCWCGAFEYNDCIGENFVLSPDGGGYFVGNSRYGYYQRGNPGALSGRYDKQWWYELLMNDFYYAGQTLAQSKVPFINQAKYAGTMRYIMFELNLFGDPETPIWNAEMAALSVDQPDSILMGDAVPCTVTVMRDGMPSSGETVCLYRAGEVFERETTNASGLAIFSVSTSEPGPITVTATGRNAQPSQCMVQVYPDYPYAMYDEHRIDDSESGNPNGRAEPGETDKLYVNLCNVGRGEITGVEGSVALINGGTGRIQLTQSSSSYPNIPMGETAENDVPFIFSVNADCPQGYIATFVIDITADGGFHRADTFELLIKSKYILLVDDDGAATGELAYIDALDSLGYIYDVVYTAENARPEVRTYEGIIWLTGQEVESTLTQEDQDSLQAALDAGVGLFLSGQGIGDDIGETDFYRDYLHAECVNTGMNDRYINGLAGDPISDGFQLLVAGQSSADAIAPVGGADSTLIYKGSQQSAAIRYAGDYRLVYFGFGFEGIKDAGGTYTSPYTVLTRVIDWVSGVEEEEVGPPVVQAPVFHLAQNAPNPFNRQSEIRYQLPAKLKARLMVYNILGERVVTLVDEEQGAGAHTVVWDGKNARREPVASGVYFYRLEAGEHSGIQKMLLVK